MITSAEWDIPPDNIKKYENMFESIQPSGEKLPGPRVKPILMDTKLPVEVLGKIWDLSDVDKDGCLDRYEFILTMHLICRCLEGIPLPPVLPTTLIPPNKRSGPMDPLAIMPAPPVDAFSPTYSTSAGYGFGSTINRALSLVPACSLGLAQSFPKWKITPEEFSHFSTVFNSLDEDADGLVAGLDVRDFFMRSGLPQVVLAKIWDIVDSQGNGTLNNEQFAVAMHLSNEQLASGCTRALPTVLPAELVPPCLRPLELEPAAYEKSKRLSVDIEILRRERFEVESASANLNLEAQMRSTETSAMQHALDSLLQTARSLAAQRRQAECRLLEYSQHRDHLQCGLTEVTARVEDERTRVDALRSQFNSQQLTIRNQEDEISRLREQVNERTREEASLRDEVAENRRRLEAVEAENKATSLKLDQAVVQISTMESTRVKLIEALDKYSKLLKGDTYLTEPDEEEIKTLTLETSSIGSLGSFDTGLGMGRSVFDNDIFVASTTLPNNLPASTRGDGATSVPLGFMNSIQSSAFTAPTQLATRNTGGAKSSMAFSSDPFSIPSYGLDPFVTSFDNVDPFKEFDPFVQDPFTPISTATQAPDPFIPLNTDTKFDPFCDNTFSPDETSFSFDAFSNTTLQVSNDHFNNDPFSFPVAQTKKTPPKRPQKRPGEDKKSPVEPDRSSLHSTAPAAGGEGKKKFSIGSDKVTGLFRNVRASKRLESDKMRAAASGSSISPGGSLLSEADQLEWATSESHRLAQAEEKARLREQEELMLAIRLSQLEASADQATEVLSSL